MGRTGLTGRGMLRRYGPNHLCTAVITRSHILVNTTYFELTTCIVIILVRANFVTA